MRNDVVHKGMFVTVEQAIDFGQAAVDSIWPVLRWIYSDLDLIFVGLKVQAEAREKFRKAYKADYQQGLDYPMVFNRIHDDIKPDVAKRVKNIQDWREGLNRMARAKEAWAQKDKEDAARLRQDLLFLATMRAKPASLDPK